MSKYINTEDLHKVVLKRKVEYGSLADSIDNIVEGMVKETPYADVVEEEKVDRAIKEMEREQNSDFWNSVFQKGISYALELLKKNLGE